VGDLGGAVAGLGVDGHRARLDEREPQQDELGAVGELDEDAVAVGDAEGAQGAGQAGGAFVQVGVGEGEAVQELVVLEFRLPRVLAALLVGCCLGAAGAQFQTLTRNPLGSPDIIGFTGGAALGAVLAAMSPAATPPVISTAAVVSGLLTAAAIYLLAWRRGVSVGRLVLVGVAAGAMLQSALAYLLIRGDVYSSQSAHIWLVGSVTAATWPQVAALTAAMAPLVPAALVLVRPLDQLQLGDETARALGVRVERVRLGVTATAVGLTSVAVATAGPIAFVALAAPQLARRLTRAQGTGLVPAALMGAAVLTAADLGTRLVPLPGEVPVGAVTGALGGCYLAWMLRRRR
jgi:iron complex transport system permease protein